MHINKYDKHLSNATNQLNIINHKLKEYQPMADNQLTNLLIEASSLKISLTAYQLYKEEVEQSPFYSCKKDRIGNFIIQRKYLSSAPRVFQNVDDRCKCDKSMSWLIQCHHKICLVKKFDMSDFDIRHHYRSKSCI